MNNWLFWSLITLLCIAVQGFYSMLEMACVSFNRVRLEYYVQKKLKRALWLQYLLKKPSRLFGTVMLGVNVALQVGSQSARELYRSIGLDPDLAPITQVFLVVILAELAPLFAARRYSEHVVRLGIPIIYASQRILAPLIWVISKITYAIHRLFGKEDEEFDLLVSRDELQKVLEGHEEIDDFNTVVSKIFGLRNKTAAQVMQPLSEVPMMRAQARVGELRRRFQKRIPDSIPLFHRSEEHIVAIAHVKDLVRASDNKPLRENARSPWFITTSTKLMPILAQFRRNHQNAAIVLNEQGSAVGLLTLDAIIEEVFEASG